MTDVDLDQTAMLVEPLRSLTASLPKCLQRWMVLEDEVRAQCFLVLHGGDDRDGGERRTLNGRQLNALYTAALEQTVRQD